MTTINLVKLNLSIWKYCITFMKYLVLNNIVRSYNEHIFVSLSLSVICVRNQNFQALNFVVGCFDLSCGLILTLVYLRYSKFPSFLSVKLLFSFFKKLLLWTTIFPRKHELKYDYPKSLLVRFLSEFLLFLLSETVLRRCTRIFVFLHFLLE